MKSKVIVALICLLSISSFAQSKVGTVNSELIVGLMPETKKVLKLIEDYGKRLDTSFANQMNEYVTKVNDFNEKKSVFSEDYQQIKLQEFQKMQNELNQSKQNGNKLMQMKRDEVMRPLYGKLMKIVAEVAKAEGYTQILTSTGNEFAYYDEQYDITQKVMDKMGIKLPKQTK